MRHLASDEVQLLAESTYMHF